MKNFLYLLGGISFLFVSHVLVAGDKDNVIMLNSEIRGRVYEGMGSLSAGASSRLLRDYPEPQRSVILDYLFKPGFGASLDHLKTEIGGDMNSTCGTEPSHQHSREDLCFDRGYEWWLMKEACSRNPDIVLDVLPWGAPGWIGNGKFYSGDMSDYVVRFLKGARDHHGLDIDYVGIWNERPYNTDYIKELHEKIAAAGLNTKIAAADEIRSYYICREMLADPELYSAVDVVGTHYPHGQGEQLYNGKTVYEQYGEDYRIVWKEALECGKPIWSLEDGPWAEDWNGAKGLIKVLIHNYIEAKMVKTISWSLISSYHDEIAITASGLMKANTPWSGHYELKPALWAMAHFTQFARPGWIFLEGSANGYLKKGGSYVSLCSPDGKDISIIAETVEATESQELEMSLVGDYTGKCFRLWQSDSLEQFVCMPDVIVPENGKIVLSLEKGHIYSLTTTAGQRKDDPGLEIPGKQYFPIPYRDDFDEYEPETLPRYTSDISGVFEVCKDGGNGYLKQVVTECGIEWAASLNPEPLTVIGDFSMEDYTVSSDVMMEDRSGKICILGRIPQIIQGQVVRPYGYWLEISGDSGFRLCKTLAPLKNGWSEFPGKWPESRSFFPDDTSQSRVFMKEELSDWPAERIALFEGLAEILSERAGEKDEVALVMFSNGSYQIFPVGTLASGSCGFRTGEWNKVALGFHGDRITASVNGKVIARVKDAEYTKGIAGLGTGWNTARFDNFEILH